MSEAMKAIDWQRRNEEMARRMFEEMMKSFLNRWAPEDAYERSEFESELHVLVRQIYIDAQSPLLDHITKIIQAMPMMPFLERKT